MRNPHRLPRLLAWPRHPIRYGDLRNRLDRISRQLSGGRTADRVPRQSELAGAREVRAGSARAAVDFAATAFELSAICRFPECAGADVSGRFDDGTLWACRRRVSRACRYDRFDDSLRGFTEPQIREAMHERELARLARGDATGAAGAEPQRVAAVFARLHGGSGREAEKRSGHGRWDHRLGALRLRSLRAHEEIF